MPITKQVYEWTLNGEDIGNDATQIPPAGVAYSIFVGPYGHSNRRTPWNTTMDPRNKAEVPPFVSEDMFVVVEFFASTPGLLPNYAASGGNLVSWSPNGFVQIVVETTGYYQDPANVYDYGISGDASPFPWFNLESVSEVRHYALKPPLYILPLQTWDIRYTMMNDLRAAVLAGGLTVPDDVVIARCFIQYQLYNGADAMICERLVKLGIPVTVDNVEWFKRQLLQSQGLPTQTFEYYLQLSESYREKERKLAKHYSRGRPKEVHTDHGGDTL